MTNQRISISLTNIVLLVTLPLLLILLWQLRSLIVVLMIAVVLSATLAPIVNTTQKVGMPRFLAILVVYAGLIATLTVFGLIIGPTVAEQIQRLIGKLPVYLEALRSLLSDLILRFGMDDTAAPNIINQLLDVQGLTSWAIRSSQQLVIRSYSVTRGIIGSVFSALLALLLSAYMLSTSKQLLEDIINLFPNPWNKRLAAQIQPVGKRMGGYIQGRILVSGILGVVITVSLKFLGLSELALGLGVIAGFTNLIPFFGPVIGAIPALIVATSLGGGTNLCLGVALVCNCAKSRNLCLRSSVGRKFSQSFSSLPVISSFRWCPGIGNYWGIDCSSLDSRNGSIARKSLYQAQINRRRTP